MSVHIGCGGSFTWSYNVINVNVLFIHVIMPVSLDIFRIAVRNDTDWRKTQYIVPG